MTVKNKIVLILAGLLLAGIGYLTWANFDTIVMIKTALFETPESISKRIEDAESKQKKALEDAGIGYVRPLTDEEKDELTSGGITEEEAVKIVTGQTTIDEIKGNDTSKEENKEPTPENSGAENTDKKPEPEKTEPSAPTAPSQSDPTNQKVAELVGRIYVLEAKFTSELSSLEKWAIDEYESVSKSEKPNKKKELSKLGYPKLAQLEKECDEEVERVLAELTTVLKNSGQSTDLVQQIREAYQDKKVLKKSYYISEYL